MRTLLVAAAALTLAACQSTAPATVKAECRLIDAPPHVIRAVNRSGQFWVDKLVEAAVEVCGHPRPKMWEDMTAQLGSSARFISEPESRVVRWRGSAAGGFHLSP